MKTKLYFKDYGGERTLILGESTDGEIIAVGEVLDINSEKYLHFKKEDFMKFVKGLKDDLPADK